jgi:hypothetical protein
MNRTPVRLIPKAELERQRLIAEARAIYESIFPSAPMSEKPPCFSDNPDGAPQ